LVLGIETLMFSLVLRIQAFMLGAMFSLKRLVASAMLGLGHWL